MTSRTEGKRKAGTGAIPKHGEKLGTRSEARLVAPFEIKPRPKCEKEIRKQPGDEPETGQGIQSPIEPRTQLGMKLGPKHGTDTRMTLEADSGTKHGAEAAPKPGVKKQNKIATQHESGCQAEPDAKCGPNVEST
jgi:hypothetical protein